MTSPEDAQPNDYAANPNAGGDASQQAANDGAQPTAEQQAQAQQGAEVAPNFFAISPRGSLVMGYNVPLDIVNGPADKRLWWTQQRLNVCVSAVMGGQADEYAAEYAQGQEYEGYEIVFLSPLKDESMENILAEAQKSLPREDIALIWEHVEVAAPEAVKQVERSLAEALRPISEEQGCRVVLWAVMLGEQKQAGVLAVPEGGQPVPYDGDILNQIEQMIVAHKAATYMVEGRAWVSLMAHVDAKEGFYFDPQFEKLPDWVQPPSEEDWQKERATFPVVEKDDSAQAEQDEQ